MALDSFKDQAEKHALETSPKEACGVVIDGQYWRCRNIADKPEDDFVLHPKDYALARTFGPIEGIVHSHPQGDPPSEADLRAQRQTKLPWYIYLIPKEKWLTINP